MTVTDRLNESPTWAMQNRFFISSCYQEAWNNHQASFLRKLHKSASKRTYSVLNAKTTFLLVVSLFTILMTQSNYSDTWKLEKSCNFIIFEGILTLQNFCSST